MRRRRPDHGTRADPRRDARIPPAHRQRHDRTGGLLCNRPLPGNGGLQVTFDQYQYGTNPQGLGADGIGFFLVDGATGGTPEPYAVGDTVTAEGAYPAGEPVVSNESSASAPTSAGRRPTRTAVTGCCATPSRPTSSARAAPTVRCPAARR
ncbi:hypothetical protein [Streptomyces avicenniae]|uniref:hypothetical protein n=1 Tax=Streptomyces avicenniae TaxID=500153 RepID=UPI00167ECD98|nr:hypothetical protein [Streptomyces avicenniae]